MLSVLRPRFFNQILSRRSIRTGYPNLISEKAYRKFKLKQAKMQCENDRPTYLKCGLRDKIVYWICCTLTICNIIVNFTKGCKLVDEYSH